MTPAELNQSISLMSGCTNMRSSSQHTPSTTSILAYMFATWHAGVTGIRRLAAHFAASMSSWSAVGEVFEADSPGASARDRAWKGLGAGGRVPRNIADKAIFHVLPLLWEHWMLCSKDMITVSERCLSYWERTLTADKVPLPCAAIARAPLNAAFTTCRCSVGLGQGCLSWFSLSGRYSIEPVPSKLTSSWPANRIHRHESAPE